MVWASEVWVVKFKCQDTPIACLDVLEDVFKWNCVIPVFIRPHMTFFPLHNSVQFHILYINRDKESTRTATNDIKTLCYK